MSEKQFPSFSADNTPKSLVGLATDPTFSLQDQLVTLGGLNVGDPALADRIPEDDVALLDTHFSNHLAGSWDSVDAVLGEILSEVPDFALVPVVNNLSAIHPPDKYERNRRGDEPDELEWAIGQVSRRAYIEGASDALSEARRRYTHEANRFKSIRGIKVDLLTLARVIDMVDPDQPDDQLKRNDELLDQGAEMARVLMDDDIVDTTFGNTVSFGSEKARVQKQGPLLLFAARVHRINTLRLDWAFSPLSGLVEVDNQSPNEPPDGLLKGRVMHVERFLRGLHSPDTSTLITGDTMKPFREAAAFHALGLVSMAQELQLARMIAAEQN